MHLCRSTRPSRSTRPPRPPGWRRGPLTVNVTGTDAGLAHRDGVARRHLRPVDARRGGHRRRHRHPHASDRRRGRRRQPRPSAPTSSGSTTRPARQHHHAGRLAGRRGQRHGQRHRRRLRRRPRGVAARRATPGSGPDGTTVRISTHGQHTLKTKPSTTSATSPLGHAPSGRHRRPARHHRVPDDWVTTPPTIVNVTGPTPPARGVVRLEWEPRRTAPPATSPTGDARCRSRSAATASTSSRSRLTDAGDRVRMETHVRQDRHRHADRHDHGRHRLAAARGAQRHRPRHGRALRHPARRVAARRRHVGSAPSAPRTTSGPGNGQHTLETRVVDNAGHASAWIPRTIQLDSTAPPTSRRSRRPAGATRRTRSCSTAPTPAPAWLRRLALQLDGGRDPSTSARAGVETATVTADGTHTLKPASATSRGNFSGWRPETIKIDTVTPTDDTVYPSAPVGNRHMITFARHRRPLRRRRRRVEARRRRRQDDRVGDDHRRRRRTRSRSRVQDNAGNWSDWADAHGHRRPRRSTPTAPTDTTSIPTLWRTAAYTVTVAADDDIDGTGVDYVEWRFDGNADRRAARRAPRSRSPPTASTTSRRAPPTRPATSPPGARRP